MMWPTTSPSSSAKRDDIGRVGAQRVDDVCFGSALEGGDVDGANLLKVLELFSSNSHYATPPETEGSRDTIRSHSDLAGGVLM